MLDDISQSEPAPALRPAASVKTEGGAKVHFSADGPVTRLKHLYQHDPVRVLFPTPRPGDITEAAIVTTSGGLVGGDRIDIELRVGSGGKVLAIAQAAEKIYRSAGEDCLIDVKLNAGESTWLEYLPQETILFDGARLRRTTTLNLDSGARILAGEMVVFGRIGSGERMRSGFVRDAWDVSVAGRRVWADALHLDGEIGQAVDHPAGLNGANALATAVYAAPDAAEYLDFARESLSAGNPGFLAGATLVNGLLVARWIGIDAQEMRAAFAEYWAGLRHRAQGLPETMPRLWHI
ncbi:MAG: urease accessory protein UreD [Rhodospirillales bacterium]|nr:urease accessory protein UreD [Rhodospirillales bacterium]